MNNSLVENICVVKFTVNLDAVGILPHESFEKIFAVILSVPNGAVETAPVNIILKPREGGVDAGIERLDIIEKRFTNVGDVLFSEGEEMALLIVIGVLHIKEDGQFKQDARVLDNFFAEDSLFGDVGWGQGVGVMISPAFEPCAVSVVDIACKYLYRQEINELLDRLT